MRASFFWLKKRGLVMNRSFVSFLVKKKRERDSKNFFFVFLFVFFFVRVGSGSKRSGGEHLGKNWERKIQKRRQKA